MRTYSDQLVFTCIFTLKILQAYSAEIWYHTPIKIKLR